MARDAPARGCVTLSDSSSPVSPRHGLSGDRRISRLLDSPTVLASTEDRDNWIKNLVTIRGEIHLGMAILNPQAIVNVDLP
jgi:hypothetical protein